MWFGALAQAESASAEATTTILLKLDARIAPALGAKHKGNLAAFLNQALADGYLAEQYQ
jgi:hypothetical protein